MKKNELKQGFRNFPKVLRDCPNWNVANKDKVAINVNFIKFIDGINDLSSEDKLKSTYEYIVSHNIQPKDKNQKYINLATYELFLDGLINGVNISKSTSTSEDKYYSNLFNAICYKCYNADSSNPKTFTTYLECFNFLNSDHPLINKLNIRNDVLSFCFTNTPFFCIDIDKDKQNGKLTEFTFNYVNRLRTYTEISQSGLGVHIIGIGDKLQSKSKNTSLNIEIYDTNRQIVLTGDLLQLPNGIIYGNIENRQEDLTLIENEVFNGDGLPLPINEEDKESVILNNSSSEELDIIPNNYDLTPEDKDVIATLRHNDFDGLFYKVFTNGFIRCLKGDKVKFLDITKKENIKLIENSQNTSEKILVDNSSTDIWLCNRIASISTDPTQILRIWKNSEHTKKRNKDKDKLNRNKYLLDTVENAIKYNLKNGKFNRKEKNNVNGDLPFECDPLSFANYLSEEIKDLLYLPDFREKGYYIYNGKIWQNATSNQILKWLGDYIKENINFSSSSEFKKFQKTLRSPDGLKKVLTFLQASITKNNSDIFNKEEFLLCVNNGVIDLKNGDLLPFNRNYYFNNLININYDPTLDLTDFKFYDALYNIFENEEDKEDTEKTLKSIQKILGYALTGDISKQKIFVMVGKGRNGKSFLQNILLKILGKFGIIGQVNTILLDKFGNNSKSHLILDLKDKRTVFFNEFNSNQKFDIGRLKNISGGDILTGDAKFTNTVNFTPTCKIFLTSNYIPCFDSNDSAFIRRLIIIPFNNVFSDEEEDIKKGCKRLIPNLDSTLFEEEKEKIFSWMVKGAIELYKDGDFEFSNLIKDKTKEIILEFNPLGEFLTLFTPIGTTSRKNLWQLYCQYVNKEDQNYKRQKDLIDALCNSSWNITKPNSHYLQGISINLNNEWIKDHLLFTEDGKLNLNNGNIQFGYIIEE